jgi:ABC-2 type transport system permease protein
VRVLWRVIVKELLQLRRDRRMIPIIFVAPVLQLVVFGFAVNTDVTDVPLVLADRDRSAESRELVQRFVESGYFQVAGVVDDLDAVEPWLVSGRAQMALVIGEGYGAAVASGRAARVQAIADGSDASPATVALGYASGIVSGRSAEIVAERLRTLVESAAETGRRLTPPGRTEAVPRVWYNPDLKSRWFYVPAVLAMILMIMTTLLSAMAVVREKEIGTLEQISVTPIRPWQLLVGKLAPFAAIGFVQVFLVTGVAVFGFGVPLRGSFLLLLGLTQLFLLNTLGLGLLVSTLVRNQQQAMMAGAFLVMVPMIYLSGLIFPIENMPPAIQGVTYAIPLRYYANVLRGIFLRGSGLSVLWPEAVTLAAMGMVIMGGASLRFRKRLD